MNQDITCNFEMLKKNIEQNGMYKVSSKKTIVSDIWKYIFQELCNGLETNRFRKTENLFELIIKNNIIVVVTNKRARTFRSFQFSDRNYTFELITSLNEILKLYNLTILLEEPRKTRKNSKFIPLKEIYRVKFA